MGDTNDTGDGGQQQADDGKGGEGFKPITSQADLDRLIGDRIARERNKFADYDDIKAKAARLDEIEQASKSDLEKAQERIAELEGTLSQAQRAALVARIASEEGVIPEVLHGDTEEEMRAAAARIKEWAGSTKKAPPVPTSLKSGSSGSPDTGEKGRAAAALRSLRNS